MQAVLQKAEILTYTPNPRHLVEMAGRTCYQSEPKGDPDPFIRRLISRGHESVIEHAVMTVRFLTDRGVTHELVRHRLASYSQESTRYCNYGNRDIRFVIPVGFRRTRPGFYTWEDLPNLPPGPEYVWVLACLRAEEAYNRMLEMGCRPEEARAVLPNSLAAEIIMTANLREWRHVFRLRTSPAAHPQMRDLMLKLLEEVRRNEELAVFFEDC